MIDEATMRAFLFKPKRAPKDRPAFTPGLTVILSVRLKGTGLPQRWQVSFDTMSQLDATLRAQAKAKAEGHTVMCVIDVFKNT